jgi:prepilin-type processing-associated H-X9-DG protein
MPFEESAGRATCKKHLKETARALRAYASEHDGEFPQGGTAVEMFGELIEEGLLGEKSWDPSEIPVYVCPSARGDVARWRRNRKLAAHMCSYEWVSGLSEESPPEFALVFDKAGNHDGEGRNVLFVDGHVEWTGEEHFQGRMEWQGEMRRRMKEGGEYVDWHEWRDEKNGGDAGD